MKGSVRISEKYGVNPSLSQCYYCGEDKNEILLLGKLPNDEQAPHRAVFDKVPCDNCASYMKLGVMLIKVRGDTPSENPDRMGRLVVVKDEAIGRMPFSDETKAAILKSRVGFITEEVWAILGIDAASQDPRGKAKLKKVRKREAKKTLGNSAKRAHGRASKRSRRKDVK